MLDAAPASTGRPGQLRCSRARKLARSNLWFAQGPPAAMSVSGITAHPAIQAVTASTACVPWLLGASASTAGGMMCTSTAAALLLPPLVQLLATAVAWRVQLADVLATAAAVRQAQPCVARAPERVTRAGRHTHARTLRHGDAAAAAAGFGSGWMQLLQFWIRDGGDRA